MSEPDAFHQAWIRAECEREQRDVDHPSPHALWQQAGGDRERYRALMVEHGHLIPAQPDRPASAERPIRVSPSPNSDQTLVPSPATEEVER